MKKKRNSPMQRSLSMRRSIGQQCAIVEKWNSYAKIRMDLFGFGDILFCDPAKREIGIVQTTTGAHRADRRTKILENKHAVIWLRAGGKIFVDAWKEKKKKPRGRRSSWECVIDNIEIEKKGLR